MDFDTNNNSPARLSSQALPLPVELVKRIFSFLANDRAAIGNARLTCSDFEYHATELLVPRVTFSYNLRTVQQTHHVITHPRLQRYVKELVFDATHYDAWIAATPHQYSEACSENPRALDLFDPQATAAHIVDNKIWEELRSYIEPQLSQETNQKNVKDSMHSWAQEIPADSEDLAKTLEMNSPVPTEQYDTAPLQTEEREGLFTPKILAEGYYHGYAQYHRLWKDQQRLQNAGVGSMMIKKLLLNSPRLHRVVYTDYRHFARPGESFESLCSRKFGTSNLEPDHLATATPEEWSGLVTLLCALASHPGHRVTEFIIENSNTATLGSTDWSDFHYHYPRYVPMTIFTRMPEHMIEHVATAFSGFKELSFAFSLPPLAFISHGNISAIGERHFMQYSDPLARFIDKAAPTLTKLSLGVADQIDVKKSEDTTTGPPNRLIYRPVDPCTEKMFSNIFSTAPENFKQLRELELYGFVLDSNVIPFLANLPVLESFKLQNCIFLDENHERAVKDWAINHELNFLVLTFPEYDQH